MADLQYYNSNFNGFNGLKKNKKEENEILMDLMD